MEAAIQTIDFVLTKGDRVRSDAGEEGTVVVVSFDGRSVYVQLDGSSSNSTLAIYRISQLTRV
jgi:hypothetical protein